MQYYCYISQTKVDQLLDSIGERNPTEWEEDSARKRDKKACAGLSKLLALFSADVSYGRSDVIQTKIKLKMTYASKLRTLLRQIAPDVTDVGTLSDIEGVAGCMYLYRGEFVVTDVDSEQLMARLDAKDGNRRLVLHCSLKFFSEPPVKDAVPSFHSTNYAFFKHRLPITFETLFIVLRQEGDIIFGSPLYLKLAPIKGVLI